MYNKVKLDKIDIIVEVGVFLFVIAIFSFLSCIMYVDLKYPMVYGGELTDKLIFLKAVLREGSLVSTKSLGAPFGTNMLLQFWEAPLPMLCITILCKLIYSVGLGVNIYYICSFGLSSVIAYYMLRKLNVENKYAVVGAMIYAFLPAHILMGEEKLFLGSNFLIPLVVLLGQDICSGEIHKTKNGTVKGIAILLLISLFSVFHGVFAMLYLGICVVINTLNTKTVTGIYYYLKLLVVELVYLAVITLPLYVTNNMELLANHRISFAKENITFKNYLGLVLRYLFPVEGHRIKALDKFYDQVIRQWPIIGGDVVASLGLLMAIGLVIGIICCFRKRASKNEKEFGVIMIALILLTGAIAMTGLMQVGSYISFVAVVAVTIFTISMQKLGTGIIDVKWNVHVSSYFCVIVLLFGLFEQTTLDMAVAAREGAWIQGCYEDDIWMMEQIEKKEGENADILVLPFMTTTEMTTHITESGIGTEGSEQMPYLASQTSNWSNNSKNGDRIYKWMQQMEQQDLHGQIKSAIRLGFDGIMIYKGGYEDAKLGEIKTQLHFELGMPQVTDSMGYWEYYSLGEKREVRLSEECIDSLGDMFATIHYLRKEN